MNKNNINLKFKSMEEVKIYAEANDRVLLVHNDLILDVTTFHAHHPGGGILLRNHQNKDIKQQLDYHQPLTITFADTMAIGSFKKDIERIIDPLRPLSPQIWAADEDTYMKLINSPHWMFVESPRMF